MTKVSARRACMLAGSTLGLAHGGAALAQVTPPPSEPSQVQAPAGLAGQQSQVEGGGRHRPSDERVAAVHPELGLNASYTDTEFTRLNPGTPFSLSDHLIDTPKRIADLSGQYTGAFRTRGDRLPFRLRLHLDGLQRASQQLPLHARGHRHRAERALFAADPPAVLRPPERAHRLHDRRRQVDRGGLGHQSLRRALPHLRLLLNRGGLLGVLLRTPAGDRLHRVAAVLR